MTANKKYLSVVFFTIALLWSSPLLAGVTAWGLTEQDIGSRNKALQGRIGYRIGLVEPFVGSTWRPNFDADGALAPPQLLSLGTVYHGPDLIDPNSSIPWIPDIMLALLPADYQARPYFGGQFSINFIDKDSGFYAPLVGLLCKFDPDKPSALVIEAAYNENFGAASAVPDEARLSIGWYFHFK